MKQIRALHSPGKCLGRCLLGTCLLMLPLLAVGCSRSPQEKKEGTEQNFQKNQQAKVIWTCSMHPQIREDHPGNCPICGMALVPLHSHEESQTVNPGPSVSETPSAMTGQPTRRNNRK